jgi:hypothetical protein
MTSQPFSRRLASCTSLGLLVAATIPAPTRASPTELLADYSARSARAPEPARGSAFFTSRHGREWSCSSCHGTFPIGAGRHAATGKPIAPMAPVVNPERFSNAAKVEKWFRRNCNDVLGRECDAGEKADVLAWLMTLKP